MRKTLPIALCVWALAAFAAAPAAAQEEAPVDTEAATARDDDPCSRRVRGYGARCRTAISLVQGCVYEIDVRASALRFASGRRRHARIAVCAPSPSAA